MVSVVESTFFAKNIELQKTIKKSMSIRAYIMIEPIKTQMTDGNLKLFLFWAVSHSSLNKNAAWRREKNPNNHPSNTMNT